MGQGRPIRLGQRRLAVLHAVAAVDEPITQREVWVAVRRAWRAGGVAVSPMGVWGALHDLSELSMVERATAPGVLPRRYALTDLGIAALDPTSSVEHDPPANSRGVSR